MSDQQDATRSPRSDEPGLSFDIAFVAGGLTVGGVLLAIFMTIKDLFPLAH